MNIKLSSFLLSKFSKHFNFNNCRKAGIFDTYSQIKTLITVTQVNRINSQNGFIYQQSQYYTNGVNASQIQDNISALQIKKRPPRTKRSLEDNKETNTSGCWTVKAMATADEYNLETLQKGLLEQNLYVPNKVSTLSKSLPDVIHAEANYGTENEGKHLFFFREGTVVMWNVSELECGNILRFLKQYERNSYGIDLIDEESEIMNYKYSDHGKKSHLKDGNIILALDATVLDKYTFSNAIAQSVILGIWEASLDHYVESVASVTSNLKMGQKLGLTREEVLKKQGELFSLRHVINLSSDLLDTPDFYWERDDLERLYHATCGYFSVTKRTRVMNEKLNHCAELVEILSSHLSDRHHIRLEWMIIVLIMVEVAFEALHYAEKFL